MYDKNRYRYTTHKNYTIKELKEESKHIAKDIKKAYDFKIVCNNFTGEQNLTGKRNKPLSLVAVLVNDEYFKHSIDFYDTDSFLVSHRNFNRFFCLYDKGFTFILQKNDDYDLIIVIKNGTVIVEKHIEKFMNSNITTLKGYSSHFREGVTYDK